MCATKAPSVTAARQAARPNGAPVVVGLTRLDQIKTLAAAKGRVIALVPYRLTADPAAWNAAIAAAGASKMLDLAVAPPPSGMAPAGRAFPGAPCPGIWIAQICVGSFGCPAAAGPTNAAQATAIAVNVSAALT